MLLQIPDVRDTEILARLTAWLDGVDWIDGQRIAAWQQKAFRHNQVLNQFVHTA